MRAYLLTTSVVFMLLVVAHLARVASEGWGPASSPAFIISSLLAVGMTAWALILLKCLPKKRVVNPRQRRVGQEKRSK